MPPMPPGIPAGRCAVGMFGRAVGMFGRAVGICGRAVGLCGRGVGICGLACGAASATAAATAGPAHRRASMGLGRHQNDGEGTPDTTLTQTYSTQTHGQLLSRER